MNLLLFERRDEVARVPWCDARAAHVRDVLRRKVGDRVYVGVVNGPRGLGTIRGMGPEGLELEVAWEEAVVPPFPLLLLVGLPRPQTAKKLLQECTSLGASGLWFFRPGKGEASYAEASLWGSGEWERCVRLGAEQAFVTSVPEVRQFGSLAEALGALGEARVPPALPEAVAPWRIPGMRGWGG